MNTKRQHRTMGKGAAVHVVPASGWTVCDKQGVYGSWSPPVPREHNFHPTHRDAWTARRRPQDWCGGCAVIVAGDDA
ncbi:hypothetical protein [Actinacidiphila glaucinigra]|uniref:Uncharacterized protein n=1 Tax=Actinacidiphila glaucinigra TaxID=235986 RepID=A0A239MCP5_9ACTN|nr:hypothetical protein [Actinacidiphila glaucinigra]SNT39814.1 hypothetical protein SAMN05216252_123106 [Actinacidiphila glaucinigra]